MRAVAGAGWAGALAGWLVLGGCVAGGADDDAEGENEAPGAPRVSVGPLTPGTDDDLVAVIDAEAKDAEGDAVTYAYAWKQDGLPRPDLTSATVPASETTKGEVWEVTVTASDGASEGGSASASTTVVNTPPVVAVVFVNEAPTTVDDLEAMPSATDADGDRVTFSISWTLDAVAQPDSGNAIPADRTERGQVWEVAVVGADAEDSSVAAVASVEIANAPPEVLSVDVTPGAPLVTDVLTGTAEVFDADGDVVTRRFRWSADGAEVQSGLSAALAGSLLSKGQEVTLEVVANDGFVDGAPQLAAPVRVGNSTPSATGATLGPTPAFETSTLACAGVGFADADGDAEGWVFAWTVDGASVPATGATLTGEAFDRGDVVGCSAAPTDGEAVGPAQAAPPVTIANAPPSLASVALSTYAPTEADTLSVILGGATDADGDAVTFGYAWQVNGSVVGTGSTLAPSAFRKGDTVTCTVTPFNGPLAGLPITSPAATVVNTAPQVSRVTLAPASVVTDTTVTASVTASDLDGDLLTFRYAWFVNGSLISDASGPTLDGATWFGKGDTVFVVVTPDDGEVEGGTFTSPSVTVRNSSPTATGVSLAPVPAFETSTVRCVPAGFADADDDAEGWSYAWTVNGNPVAASGTELTGSSFSKGDVVRCTATPTDGEASGASVTSAALTVANSAPTLASVSLSTYTPTEADTITVSPGATSDADGDAVTYTYAWLVNDVVVASTSTLPSTAFRKGDVVKVRVTPFDGALSGTSVLSPFATVANSAPTIASVTLSPNPVLTDSRVTAEVTGSDPDGDPVTYSYAWRVDGVPVGADVPTLDGLTSFDRGQQVRVVVTPSDGTVTGASASSPAVTVRNSPPTAPGVVVTPADPEEGADLTCTLAPTATDADGDVVTYGFAWLVDGVAYGGAASGATSSAVPGVDVGGGEVWRCVVLARDGLAETEASAEVFVRPPVDTDTPPLGPDDLAPGDLIITEFMADPRFCVDSLGEYVELRYLGPGSANLRGLTVADRSSSFQIPVDVPVAPGDRVLLVANATSFASSCYGVAPDVDLPNGVALSNLGDEIRIANASGTLDSVSFPSTTFPFIVQGRSWERDDADPDVWCQSTEPISTTGDFGTPGAPNGSCGAVDTDPPVDTADPSVPLPVAAIPVGGLEITEFLSNPLACQDPNGEYVEVRNRTLRSVDLRGLLLTDLSNNQATFSTSRVLVPGETVVLHDGSVSPDCFGLGAAGGLSYRLVALTNSGGDVVYLRDGNGRILDSVDFTDPLRFPVRTGYAWQKDDSGRWCEATTPLGAGFDFGSPGVANAPCAPPDTGTPP